MSDDETFTIRDVAALLKVGEIQRSDIGVWIAAQVEQTTADDREDQA